MAITINIPKAKDCTKVRLRKERELLLAEQDILMMKAQEAGADISDIATEKQRLRDITDEVDGCSTTDELTALKAKKD